MTLVLTLEAAFLALSEYTVQEFWWQVSVPQALVGLAPPSPTNRVQLYYLFMIDKCWHVSDRL